MKTFLHVGCGPARKDQTTRGFNTPEWFELRIDTDESVQPDFAGTMMDMSAVADASVDAVFSSHNIQFLYPHQVMVALAEFKRVLKDDGFVVIVCPDLQSACAMITEDKLTETLYTSASGPVAAIDIFYGQRSQMTLGNLNVAHHCGFTQRILAGTLDEAGFPAAACMRRESHFDLRAVASKAEMSEENIRALAVAHFPE